MYRKDSIIIEEWLKSSGKALLVTGARQIGKTWLIREEIGSWGKFPVFLPTGAHWTFCKESCTIVR